jgi:hypothetical protein
MRNSTICQCGPPWAGVDKATLSTAFWATRNARRRQQVRGPPIKRGNAASETFSVCLSAFKTGPNRRPKSTPSGSACAGSY